MKPLVFDRKAFSLIELTFVIIVLGIVASIGSQIIVKVYESYVTQRAVHRSSLKTELALTQLVNRMTYSIPQTVIARRDAAVFAPIESIPGTNDHDILEWIGYDADSFGAITANPTTGFERRPVWSGYADVSSAQTTLNTLSTPGSRLHDLDTIIQNLSRDAAGAANSGIASAAILFPDTYDARTIGYQGGANANNIHTVNGRNGDTVLNLNPSATGTRTVKEHYKLAWSAYAVVPVALTAAQLTNRGFDNVDIGSGLWDLRLYYDYQPWNGENYQNGKSQILIRNVSVFNFTGTGSSIRMKICQRENVGGAYTINTCKEKAVIR